MQPLPKSNASSGFLATLLAVKFVDSLPLVRWVIGSAGVLQPAVLPAYDLESAMMFMW